MNIYAELRRYGAGKKPKNLVHFCFLAVFIFSTCLTLHEAQILKNSYEIDQHRKLNAIGSILERQFQFSLGELYFYRAMLNYALKSPVDSDNARRAIALFNQQRRNPVWQININTERSMPLNGVSDSWLTRYPLLKRDNSERLNDEIRAALEFSFILQFSDPVKYFYSRLWYLSRAGFFVSSRPPVSDTETLERYEVMIQCEYFTGMSPENNPQRQQRWTPVYQSLQNEEPVVTVSVPVDNEGSWYGVLAMDFTNQRIHEYLQQALQPHYKGIVMLLDSQLNTVAISDNFPYRDGHSLSPDEKQQLREAVQQRNEGDLRFGTRFISWQKMRSIDGVLINIQTLREGLSSESGRVALVLLLMWLLFSLTLLASHQAIIRLVGHMMTLHNRLAWRANYDGLTRLYNRAAFFDVGEQTAALCERNGRPLSLLQLDVDNFKSVNDNYGHQAGDLALSQVADVIRQVLRKTDVAGRLGGEEFCVLLPETSLVKARAIAERIRQKLSQEEVLIDSNRRLRITASLGVASSEEQGDYVLESLQSVADERLYQAKQRGRNRVC